MCLHLPSVHLIHLVKAKTTPLILNRHSKFTFIQQRLMTKQCDAIKRLFSYSACWGKTISWQQLPVSYPSWLESFVLLLGLAVDKHP